MVINTVPAIVREIANDSKDLCNSSFCYNGFVVLLSALFFNLSTFSSIARAFTFSLSVSSLARKASCIPHEALLRRNRNRISSLIAKTSDSASRFLLVVDDTLVRHYGKSLDNCYWFDHTMGTTTRGRNYLVIIVLDSYTGQRFPVSIVLLRGKKHPKYKPRLNVLKWQLSILKSAGLGGLTVTADSWFADKNLFRWLESNKFDFEIEGKSNRKVTYIDKQSVGSVGKHKRMVYPAICDVACSLRRNTAFSGGAPKKIASGVVKLYGSSQRLKFAAVWNIDDASTAKPFAVYFSNNTKRTASRIWALSRFRWSIECHFRQSKQDFAFDAFPVHNSETALKINILGMFLITALELKRFKNDARPKLPTGAKQQMVSLSSFVKHERIRAYERCILSVIHSEKSKEKVRNHFLQRGKPEYACKKPRDNSKMGDAEVNCA